MWGGAGAGVAPDCAFVPCLPGAAGAPWRVAGGGLFSAISCVLGLRAGGGRRFSGGRREGVAGAEHGPREVGEEEWERREASLRGAPGGCWGGRPFALWQCARRGEPRVSELASDSRDVNRTSSAFALAQGSVSHPGSFRRHVARCGSCPSGGGRGERGGGFRSS